MTITRFNQLWDALVSGLPEVDTEKPIHMNGSSPKTLKAFSDFMDGDTSKLDDVTGQSAMQSLKQQLLNP